jgi:tRNA(Met) cytidine acetyltransferase
VRIATHPDARRRGLARALVEHVHRAYPSADLFGTMFGANPELLAFRHDVGYALVRVGASRGARTGEPSAVMLREGSERGARLLGELREELARDLPLQIELLDADGELGLDPRLRDALSDAAPPLSSAPVLSDADVRARVASYLGGPRPFEAVAWAVTQFVAGADLAVLEEREQALVEGRVLKRRSWRAVAADAGYANAPTAMRALRPAVRKLFDT